MSEYLERDTERLDEIGDFYTIHVNAMTSEGLHSKSDIAAELGHRDAIILGLMHNLKAIAFTLKDVNQKDCSEEIWDKIDLVLEFTG